MPPPDLTEQSTKEAIDWVLQLRSETCTPDQRRLFADWLAQHPGHQQLYDRYDANWQGLDRFKGVDFPVRQAALNFRPPARKPRQFWPSLALAASLVLALGLTAISPNGWYGTDAQYSVAQGNRETIILADGSHLELNGGTEVKVHLSRWRRSVELVRGEAFFNVVHELERPFVVAAANGSIVDIGTQFEVYLKSDKVLVAVQEGSVRVDTKDSQELAANQLLAYNRAGDFMPMPSENVDTLTAWRQGQLVFDNRRLDEVLAELGRYHATQVHLGSPGLAKLKVSGRFRIDRLDSALATIASTLSVTLQRTSPDEVVLKER